MNLVIILGEILNIEYKIIDKGKVYAIAFSEIKIEMAKWIRNQYDKMLTYDNLMKAHKLSKRGKGLEIGNYTSQTFANIYLNEIDQYATKVLKVKHYYRYMDDTVILVKTKQEAKIILKKIELFLKEKLDLELNDKTNIFKSKQGVNFCGYKINEYRIKVRSKGKKKFKKKVKDIEKEIKAGTLTSKEARMYLTGHLGYFGIANTYDLKRKNILL